MEIKEFYKKMFACFEQAKGDFSLFWGLLNDDSVETDELRVYLYVNEKEGKFGKFVSRIAKLHKDDDYYYNFEFKTPTVPKYHGWVKLTRYHRDDEARKIVVYKYEFETSKRSDRLEEIDAEESF